MAHRKKTPEKISIEITPGELFDRIAILFVKSTNIRDQTKRRRALASYLVLLDASRSHGYPIGDNELYPDAFLNGQFYASLVAVHERLWTVEDNLRRYEGEKDFGAEFVSNARLVYQYNDERSRIKRQIDEHYGFQPEVKEYVSYDKKEGDDEDGSGSS